MWVLGQKGALGIKRLCNGHGDVTAVSTGPPPVMDLGIKRPGLLGGPVERTTHRPRFGASPSLLCSSVTKKRTKCHEAFFFPGCLRCPRTHRTAHWAPPHARCRPFGARFQYGCFSAPQSCTWVFVGHLFALGARFRRRASRRFTPPAAVSGSRPPAIVALSGVARWPNTSV